MPDEYALRPAPPLAPPYRVPQPEFRAPQRARLVIDHVGGGEGWAQIDGSWVHILLDDEGQGGWRSFPMHSVIVVSWL